MPQPFAQRSLTVAQMNAYMAEFIRPDQTLTAVDNFTYNLGPIVVGRNTVTDVSATFETQSDSDFLLIYLSADGFTRAARTQITDIGTGKTFFNVASPFVGLFGSIGFPFTLPTPRLLMPNTSLKFDIHSSDGDSDGYIALAGLRLYYADPTAAVSTALAS